MSTVPAITRAEIQARLEAGNDVVIRSLRRKLGAIADRIETVRGVGYRLR
jgi:DNA-binding response OmpR family regulator